MRCLTLTQPWATLVSAGEKRVETRSWYTPYRGPLAIHAAKGFPRWARDLCGDDTVDQEELDDEPIARALESLGMNSSDLPLGAVVAVVRLVDVKPTRGLVIEPYERPFGDFSPGRFAWFLEDVFPLANPIPARGQLGLWEWDAPAQVLDLFDRVIVGAA